MAFNAARIAYRHCGLVIVLGDCLLAGFVEVMTFAKTGSLRFRLSALRPESVVCDIES